MNDNQNNFVRPGRTTSRVLAPSGGQSSLTFGLRPAPEVKPMPTPPAPETTVISTGTAEGIPLTAVRRSIMVTIVCLIYHILTLVILYMQWILYQKQ